MADTSIQAKPKPNKETDIKGLTLNDEQGLYVIAVEGGFSCLGYDVCRHRCEKLEIELLHCEHEVEVHEMSGRYERGSVDMFQHYKHLQGVVYELNRKHGFRSATELTPQLVGLEGRRVEVVDRYGDKRRFIVGKSSGWTPCHIELARKNSSGGSAVTGAPFKELRILSR